MDEISERL